MILLGTNTVVADGDNSSDSDEADATLLSQTIGPEDFTENNCEVSESISNQVLKNKGNQLETDDSSDEELELTLPQFDGGNDYEHDRKKEYHKSSKHSGRRHGHSSSHSSSKSSNKSQKSYTSSSLFHQQHSKCCHDQSSCSNHYSHKSYCHANKDSNSKHSNNSFPYNCVSSSQPVNIMPIGVPQEVPGVAFVLPALVTNKPLDRIGSLGLIKDKKVPSSVECNKSLKKFVTTKSNYSDSKRKSSHSKSEKAAYRNNESTPDILKAACASIDLTSEDIEVEFFPKDSTSKYCHSKLETKDASKSNVPTKKHSKKAKVKEDKSCSPSTNCSAK